MFPHGTSEEQAVEWLQQNGISARLSATLQGVLVQLWTDGYTAGLNRSKTRVIRTTVAQAVAQLASAWLNQIVMTTIKLLAQALISGAAIAGFLADPARALMIAKTEIQRAMTQAAMDGYLEAGVTHVRWITAGDSKVCAHCAANEAAGLWPLGVPFPSGAMCPPDHPNCRCWIESA